MNGLRNVLTCIATYLRPQFVAGVVKTLCSNRDKVQSFRAGRFRIRCRPPSFVAQYRSVFLEKVYDLPLDTPAPRILDLGANVGFSVLYFTTRYPGAAITAFEADPEIFALLEQNCRDNDVDGVTLVNRAAWIENTRLRFLPDGLGGGRLNPGADRPTVRQEPIEVEAIDLREWLQGQAFDLVKIDIEGAESAVIRHCLAGFASARYLVFEYHSLRGAPQELGEVLSLLESHGFRYHIQPDEGILAPFTRSRGPFDNQLFIVAENAAPMD